VDAGEEPKQDEVNGDDVRSGHEAEEVDVQMGTEVGEVNGEIAVLEEVQGSDAVEVPAAVGSEQRALVSGSDEQEVSRSLPIESVPAVEG